MDESLKRRLVGAAVLLLGALLLSSLLPDPERRPGASVAPVVAYDLRTGAPLGGSPDEPPPPPVKLKPVQIGDTAPAAKPDPSPQPLSGDAGAATPEPGAVAPAPTRIAAMPAAAGPPPAASVAAKPARPALKVDESFGLSGGSAWYVQIGSFASKENARAEQLKLAKLGLPAVLQAITVDRKLWYRVRVGPYQKEGAAQQALSTVRTHGYAAAKVVRPDNAPA